jgi:hypothetical protein
MRRRRRRSDQLGAPWRPPTATVPACDDALTCTDAATRSCSLAVRGGASLVLQQHQPLTLILPGEDGHLLGGRKIIGSDMKAAAPQRSSGAMVSCGYYLLVTKPARLAAAATASGASCGRSGRIRLGSSTFEACRATGAGRPARRTPAITAAAHVSHQMARRRRAAFLRNTSRPGGGLEGTRGPAPAGAQAEWAPSPWPGDGRARVGWLAAPVPLCAALGACDD